MEGLEWIKIEASYTLRAYSSIHPSILVRGLHAMRESVDVDQGLCDKDTSFFYHN